MQKRWNILTADEDKVRTLQQALNIHPVLCKILVGRGMETYDLAKDFFRPQLMDLHSPWLMKDMEKAVDRIISAIISEEKILVFGDYDVDGTTAVACMYQFLKKIHSHLDFYIPHRYREGYGVSKAGIDFGAPAVLRKFPSIRGEPAKDVLWPNPYIVFDGTLEECIKQFLSKPVEQRHLYEIHTAPQSEVVSNVMSGAHITELARLQEFL